ncbi:MAG TPA: D-alanine--D-alanine ligase [Thermoanaerobaculia bacterium]|nr:D-alanine--D-alanine ligase [Thermoanaerobaculia bacterium]
MRPLALALCYDLKSDYLAAGFSPEAVMEFDDEETIAGLEDGLRQLGDRVGSVDRVGRGQALARRLAAGESWDLVFNLAEGVRGRSREAQVPALCELFDQPYTFSDPLTCAVTLDKPLAKRVVRDYGLPTPAFAVVERPEDASAVTLDPPLFLKPAAEGSSKGVTERSRIATRDALEETCAELIRLFRQPVLVEAYLPGREMTVGIVGNGAEARVVGVMEVAASPGYEFDAYTARNKAEWEERMTYRLVADEGLAGRARQVALAAYHALGCLDAARVDLRCDRSGEPNFLEINPLPGLDPVKSDLPILARLAGTSYPELLGHIVGAAAKRWGLWT